MTTPGEIQLASLDSALEDACHNADHYAWNITDDDVAEAQQRLITLIANTMQRLAADITDAAHDNPATTPADIVNALRQRAATLAPESTDHYDPQTEWDEESNP